MDTHPLNVWMLIFGALLTWKLGALMLLQPGVRRSESHGPLWLLAPVMWPAVWPLWLWVILREHREAKAYLARPKPIDPEVLEGGFVRLVPEGRPYGSPIPSGGQLAREITLPQVH